MSKPIKAAVRCNSLTLDGHGHKTLRAQERHGKREDKTSQMRRVRDVKPLVFGGLDLCRLYEEHVKGVRFNSSCKRPVLHFVIKMPMQVLVDGDDAPAKFRGKSQDARKKLMGSQALKFINERHGGNAVFASRIDRDETGELIVDIFATPKYEKTTKNRGKPMTEIWASPTKYGKDLAIKHQAEIQGRHSRSKGQLTGPRHVGIALQSEFAEFFERENGMALTRTAKDSFGEDRLETEAYKEIKDAQDAVEHNREALENEQKAFQRRLEDLEAAESALGVDSDKVQADAKKLVHKEAELVRVKRENTAEKIEIVQYRQELLSERAGFEDEKSNVRDLGDKLRVMLDRVSKYIRTYGLSEAARPEAEDIIEDSKALLAPEDPSDDAGLGF